MCIDRSAAITARYETALRKKHHDRPIPAISAPASAGPTILVPVITALFRLTAFGRSFSSTISEKKLWRVGWSIEVVTPCRNESA